MLWDLLYESFALDEDSNMFHGAQGFYTIPIFHKKNTKGFTALRLHIWKEGSEENHDDRFKIHSHLCYAKSLVLYGKILNTEYKTEVTVNRNAESSLFFVKWQTPASKNINQQTSILQNTGINILYYQSRQDEISEGSIYEIKEGDYHSSVSVMDSNVKINATIFMFNSEKGWTENGYVIGPSEISQTQTVRNPVESAKMIIDELNCAMKN
ncbi:hypothetical protein DF947_01370 [Pedobacter paludis]|uniref:Uncharacterized protein n=2 Tax=Pedobacter paludis TaxID=2203212 RepID=A0A317F4Q2_9SPHI|nr:hypothetical protein DF947_01370 [Pedobacter paludis]